MRRVVAAPGAGADSGLFAVNWIVGLLTVALAGDTLLSWVGGRGEEEAFEPEKGWKIELQVVQAGRDI